MDIIKKPLVIRHKCNKIAMVREAVKLEPKGVKGIEYDVVGTKDNVPLLCHDKTIHRRLRKSAKSATDFKELKKPIKIYKLNYDKLNKRRPDIEKLEDLFEYLDKAEYSPNFEFHLEIKSPDLSLCDTILELLAAHPRIAKQTVIRSFKIEIIHYINKILPSNKVCLLLGSKGYIDKNICFRRKKDATSFNVLPTVHKVSKICEGRLPEYISVEHQMLTNRFISDMKGAGIETEVYTLNDLVGDKYMMIDRIVTDKPEKMLKQINEFKFSKAPDSSAICGDVSEQIA